MTNGCETSVKRVVLGRIVSVYGIKGWVKIYSDTNPVENILDYRNWDLELNGQMKTVKVDRARPHGKLFVVHILGCDDRDQARRYCACEITVEAGVLPELNDDEVYWHQLEGLYVYSSDSVAGDILLGRVKYLMETGANDVMVVCPSRGSIDQRERLVPWLVNRVVVDVNLAKGSILLDWNPDF